MRIFKVDTAKLAEWLVPVQLRAGVIYAFIKALLKGVQKSYDLIFKQPVNPGLDTFGGVYYSLWSWPQMLLSVYQYVQRFHRVSSSLVIARVAIANYITFQNNPFPYRSRFVINAKELSIYTPGNYDRVCWWDDVKGYERFQIPYPGNWQDDRFQIRDGISFSLPACLLVQEAAIATELLAMGLISENGTISCLLIEESEPPADIDFQFEKSKYVVPVWDTNPIIPNYYYIGDEKLKQMYVDAITVLAPFRSFGRTIRMTTI